MFQTDPSRTTDALLKVFDRRDDVITPGMSELLADPLYEPDTQAVDVEMRTA